MHLLFKVRHIKLSILHYILFKFKFFLNFFLFVSLSLHITIIVYNLSLSSRYIKENKKLITK